MSSIFKYLRFDYFLMLTAVFFIGACEEESVLLDFEEEIIGAVKATRSGIVGIEVTFDSSGATEQDSRWGDGIIINDNGDIITTETLISGYTGLTVMFQDGCHHKGRVVGVDRESNLALLSTAQHDHGCYPVKIKTIDLPPAGSIGILIGHNWVAKGVTAGMGLISHTWLGGDDFWVDPLCMIQTSDQLVQTGVGVVNARGELIGICDNYIADAKGSWTVIPTATIKRVAEKLSRDKEIKRGWAGLFCNCDYNDAHVVPPPPEGGIEILSVVSNSPAETAGLQPGDYVVRIDKEIIKKSNDLRRKITSMLPGQKILLTVSDNRNDKREVLLELSELEHKSDRSRRCSTRSM